MDLQTQTKCKKGNKVCGQTFNRNSHSMNHTGEIPYSCDVCKKLFKAKTQNNTYYERPYKCELCNKSYKHMAHLKTHKMFHTGETPYIYSFCNRSFKTVSHLKEHKRVHTGNRTHSCKVCNKSYARNSHLKIHIMSHIVARCEANHLKITTI